MKTCQWSKVGEPSEWQAGPHSRNREKDDTNVFHAAPPPSPDAAANSPAEQGHRSRTRLKMHR